MNHWTQLSIEFANQRNYLDQLFAVYPTIPEGIRDIDQKAWEEVEGLFHQRRNLDLLSALLEFDLFPLKDSYVAYLKRDNAALKRNPHTVDRLCGRLYEMGLDKIYEECSEPKETNRQIGPMFKRWCGKKTLGVQPVPLEKFLHSNNNAILDASDAGMLEFAKAHLGYAHDKSPDFVARFNSRYVIGEAKLLTDFGGHQAAQFNDAVGVATAKMNAVAVAVLDGVLYIRGQHKMHQKITKELTDCNIMSALVLREFLYQL